MAGFTGCNCTPVLHATYVPSLTKTLTLTELHVSAERAVEFLTVSEPTVSGAALTAWEDEGPPPCDLIATLGRLLI